MPFTGWAAAATGISPYVPAVGNAIGTLPGLWAAPTGSTIPAQEIVYTIATAAQTVTLGHMATWIGGAGVTAGAGINGLAIYSAAGSLLGQTVDMTAAFSATGYQQAALTAGVPIVAGTDYYLALVHNFTGTTPTVPGFIPAPGSTPNVNGHVMHVFSTGQTSFPASVSLGGLSSGAHWLYVDGSV